MKDDAAPAPAQDDGEPPQYRLTEPSYIDDRHYDQSMVDGGKAVIFFTGIPGAHMLPLNEAAKKMVKKFPPSKVDPLHAMTSLAPTPKD